MSSIVRLGAPLVIILQILLERVRVCPQRLSMEVSNSYCGEELGSPYLQMKTSWVRLVRRVEK